MSHTVLTVSTEMLGYKKKTKKTSADWFNENEKKIINERNSALQAKLRDSSA